MLVELYTKILPSSCHKKTLSRRQWQSEKMIFPVILLAFATSVHSQLVGDEQLEVHPPLSWKRCSSAGNCETVPAAITMDANWRWIHNASGYDNCYSWNQWEPRICSEVDKCTANCAYEGVAYAHSSGLSTSGDRLTQKFYTYADFSYSVNSRVFLLETEEKYQTFTLMDNELAFDVDLSTVECGINSGLRFVEMDSDGGMAKYPTNKAGAKFGTGYCDSSCPQSIRFIGGKVSASPKYSPATQNTDSFSFLQG
jgi:cellulose 1,4-beta-cellobiosidase